MVSVDDGGLKGGGQEGMAAVGLGHMDAKQDDKP